MCQCSRQRRFRLPLIANKMATHRQRPRPTVMPNWHAVTRHRTPTVNVILSSVVLLLIIMPQDALPNESATNLRVFRQQISPDRPEQNMNIGIIQVKLKNWSSTTVLPSARQTPPALPPPLTTRTRRAWPTTEVSETIVGTEQPHQHRRRWNNNVLDGGRGQQQQQKRTAQLKDAVPTRGSSGSSSGGGGGWSIDMGQDMDGLFPYLLLALGLALVAFFIILYAILNALLQRKEAQQNEEEMAGQRRRRRTRRSRRQRRGAREAEAEEDEEWMDTEDEEEADEALERERDEEEERNRGFTVLDEDELYPRHSKWGRKKQRSRAGHEDQADEIHRSRRYRSARRAQNGFAPEPPHPPLPRGRPPPRPRHVEWKDGAGGAEDAALFHDVPFPPPPPPRVPPPPPPLPARYQRRRSRASATSDPSVSLTSSSHHRAHRSPHRPSRAHPPPPPLLPADEFSDVDTESVQSGGRGSAGQRRQKTTTAAARTNHRQQRPPLPLRRENTDSTVSSVQRGRAGSL